MLLVALVRPAAPRRPSRFRCCLRPEPSRGGKRKKESYFRPPRWLNPVGSRRRQQCGAHLLTGRPAGRPARQQGHAFTGAQNDQSAGGPLGAPANDKVARNVCRAGRERGIALFKESKSLLEQAPTSINALAAHSAESLGPASRRRQTSHRPGGPIDWRHLIVIEILLPQTSSSSSSSLLPLPLPLLPMPLPLPLPPVIVAPRSGETITTTQGPHTRIGSAPNGTEVRIKRVGRVPSGSSRARS